MILDPGANQARCSAYSSPGRWDSWRVWRTASRAAKPGNEAARPPRGARARGLSEIGAAQPSERRPRPTSATFGLLQSLLCDRGRDRPSLDIPPDRDGPWRENPTISSRSAGESSTARRRRRRERRIAAAAAPKGQPTRAPRAKTPRHPRQATKRLTRIRTPETPLGHQRPPAVLRLSAWQNVVSLSRWLRPQLRSHAEAPR